jgi:hypothetical protein
VFPDVEEAPDHVCVADLAAVVPVRLPLQPVPGTGIHTASINKYRYGTYFFNLDFLISCSTHGTYCREQVDDRKQNMIT